jgi:quercetin dioxygenase-like cupin family protein
MKHKSFGLPFAVAMMAAGVMLWQAGCQGESEQDETALLPEARPGETNSSSYAPKNPYKEAATNLLARTVFEATGPGGVKIEVRDLFVLPGKTAEKVSLPGPAILEVLSGDGKMTSGDKSQELRTGAITSIAQGAAFSLESQDVTPLILRARVFAT